MSQSISWCFLKMSETHCSCTHIALFQPLVTCHTSSSTYEWALFFSRPPACKSWLLHFHINWAVITILATRIFMSHHNLDAENQKYLYSTTVDSCSSFPVPLSPPFCVFSSPPSPESPLNAEFKKKEPSHAKKKGEHPCSWIVHLLLTCT